MLLSACSSVSLPKVYLAFMHAKLFQSSPTLCDPIDCNLPDPSVHEILQARILEWIAMPFSRGSSQPRDPNWVSSLLYLQARSFPLAPPEKPKYLLMYIALLLSCKHFEGDTHKSLNLCNVNINEFLFN